MSDKNAPKEAELFPVEPEVIRFKLATLFPHYNNITYRIQPKKMEGLRTFGVTPGWHWVYGDMVPMNQDEQVAALFHEINHLLRGHCQRQGDREHEKWNWAGDFEINDWWPPSLTPPEWILKPKDYQMPDGELAEFYYSNMPEAEYHVREDATAVSPGTGACTVEGCDSKDVAPVAGDGKAKKAVRGKFHGPKCGSSHTGEAGEGTGDAPAVGELEAEAVRHQVAKDIQAEAQKSRGNIPGGMVEWANNLLNPQVPWQKLLRTAVRRATVVIAGQKDHTWNRINRRSVPPFLMPRRVDFKTIPAFYIDTSGSMSDDEINQALTEVRAAVKANASTVYVTCLDAAVYETVKVNTAGEISKVKVKGRGGTDMRLMFDHYKTLRPKPNLLICVTDGETPWPADEPRDAKTIVVLTTPEGSHGTIPEWATEVRALPEGR